MRDGAVVEAEVGLAGLLVGAVALEALLGQQRPDARLEVPGVLRTRRGRREPGAGWVQIGARERRVDTRTVYC